MREIACPSCASRMDYVHICDWHVCELCGRTVEGVTLWRRAQTRLGRLWLWVHHG